MAACGGPSAGFVKEVVEGPMIGIEVTMDRLELVKGSARTRLPGEVSLIESIEVAGDIPSETLERRFLGYPKVSNRNFKPG